MYFKKEFICSFYFWYNKNDIIININVNNRNFIPNYNNITNNNANNRNVISNYNNILILIPIIEMAQIALIIMP